jgi:hypothetical protein
MDGANEACYRGTLKISEARDHSSNLIDPGIEEAYASARRGTGRPRVRASERRGVAARGAGVEGGIELGFHLASPRRLVDLGLVEQREGRKA